MRDFGVSIVYSGCLREEREDVAEERGAYREGNAWAEFQSAVCWSTLFFKATGIARQLVCLFPNLFAAPLYRGGKA
jgi:hypothetical protein